jgi:hypothetical protein
VTIPAIHPGEHAAFHSEFAVSPIDIRPAQRRASASLVRSPKQTNSRAILRLRYDTHFGSIPGLKDGILWKSVLIRRLRTVPLGFLPGSSSSQRPRSFNMWRISGENSRC